MTHHIVSITSYHTPKERKKRKLAAVPKPQNNQPYPHHMKVTLKIILNWLQPQEIIAEYQASLRARSKYLIAGFSARNTCIINRIFSKTPLTEYGMKAYGQLWRNTTVIPTPCKSLKICISRPKAQSCSMTSQDTGSELESESTKVSTVSREGNTCNDNNDMPIV